MLKENYYFIKVANLKTGKKGYLGLDDNDEIIIINRFVSDVKTFPTYQEANDFAKARGLDKWKSVNYYIKDGNDLIGDGKTNHLEFKEPLWTVENGAGWKLFWSDKRREYYWDNKVVGNICVHQAWIDKWMPILKRKYPQMEVKLVPINLEKASAIKLPILNENAN